MLISALLPWTTSGSWVIKPAISTTSLFLYSCSFACHVVHEIQHNKHGQNARQFSNEIKLVQLMVQNNDNALNEAVITLCSDVSILIQFWIMIKVTTFYIQSHNQNNQNRRQVFRTRYLNVISIISISSRTLMQNAIECHHLTIIGNQYARSYSLRQDLFPLTRTWYSR